MFLEIVILFLFIKIKIIYYFNFRSSKNIDSLTLISTNKTFDY